MIFTCQLFDCLQFYAHCFISIVHQRALVDLNEISKITNKFFCFIFSLKGIFNLQGYPCVTSLKLI